LLNASFSQCKDNTLNNTLSEFHFLNHLGKMIYSLKLPNKGPFPFLFKLKK
jgi:hypothetical protein